MDKVAEVFYKIAGTPQKPYATQSSATTTWAPNQQAKAQASAASQMGPQLPGSSAPSARAIVPWQQQNTFSRTNTSAIQPYKPTNMAVTPTTSYTTSNNKPFQNPSAFNHAYQSYGNNTTQNPNSTSISAASTSVGAPTQPTNPTTNNSNTLLQGSRNLLKWWAPSLEADRTAGQMGAVDTATIAKNTGKAERILGKALRTGAHGAKFTKNLGNAVNRGARGIAKWLRRGGHVANNSQIGRVAGLAMSLPAYGLNAWDRFHNANTWGNAFKDTLTGLAADVGYDQTIGSTPIGLAADVGMIANDAATLATGTSPVTATFDYLQGKQS